MSRLSDILLSAANQPAVTADCVAVIEQYVADRGGLRGMGMRAALAMGKAARPDLLLRGIGHLLPDIVAALESSYEQSQINGVDFQAVLLQNSESVCRNLVAIADRRMAAVKNPSVKSIYKRLSGDAEGEVAALLPAFAAAIKKYLPKTA